MYIYIYALEREDELELEARWQWGISLSVSVSLSLPSLLCSPPSFEAPGIFPGSLLQPVYNRQQSASTAGEERGSGGAKQDFVLIPSFFPPHSYRATSLVLDRLGCLDQVRVPTFEGAPSRLTESLIFCARALNPIRPPTSPSASLEREDRMGDFQRGEEEGPRTEEGMPSHACSGTSPYVLRIENSNYNKGGKGARSSLLPRAAQ